MGLDSLGNTKTRPVGDIKVLVVDDEADLREIMAFDFESAGFQVLSAENGREALRILETNPVDAVVTDIRMPELDGVKLLEKIRSSEATKSPVVIFVTGFSDLSVEDAFEKGAEGFFVKPFDRRALVSAVADLTQVPSERWHSAPKPKEINFPVLKSTFDTFDSAKDQRKFNIGRGGFFIAHENQFPLLGNPVQFDIDFKDKTLKPIRGHGIVRWTRKAGNAQTPKGMGVEFVTLEDASIEQVNEIQKSHHSNAFIPKI